MNRKIKSTASVKSPSSAWIYQRDQHTATSPRSPGWERSARPFAWAEEPAGSSAATRTHEVKIMKLGNEGGKSQKIQRGGRFSGKKWTPFFVSPLSSCQPCSPCPRGGCHGDRRPHVLGVSFLVKGAHCSCVKPSSVCPSARDGGLQLHTPHKNTVPSLLCGGATTHKDPHKPLNLVVEGKQP